MTGWEVLSRELALPQEHQLSGGGRALWRPQSPRWLDRPGFRDGGSYAGHAVDPVFAVTLLDQHGRWIPTVATERRWSPARLELRYMLPQALIVEKRTLLSNNAFVSTLTLSHADECARDLWLVLWTSRSLNPGTTIADIEANPQGISFLETAVDASGEESYRRGCALGTNFDADSWSVDHSPFASSEMEWNQTPLADAMTRSGLPGHFPSVELVDGHLHLALAYPFSVAPGERLKVTLLCAMAPDVECARASLETSVAMIDPVHVSEEEWISWFEELPSFECSDPFLQRAYWFRAAERRAEPEQPIPHPGSSGIEIGHWIDTAWRHDTEELASQMRELLVQDVASLTESPLAIAVDRVAALHADVELTSELAMRCSSLIRDLSRRAGDGDGGSLRRLSLALALNDVLVRALPSSELETETVDGERDLLVLREELRQRYWSEECGWFSDTDEIQSKISLDGLLPILASAVSPKERSALATTLFDPEFFWTSVPLPSVSRNDPSFDPDGAAWCDPKREGAGRVWPERNSLAIECLGQDIEVAGPADRLLLAQLIRQTVMLQFPDGNVDRPASHAHYHPLTGRPSSVCGSSRPTGWILDHILRFVVGFRPNPKGEIVIDPLPFGLEWFRVDRLVVGEHELQVEWDNRTGLSLRIDGEPAGHAPVGRAMHIRFPSGSGDYESLRRNAVAG